MKISEQFNLNATQFELDFVDIDTNTDTPLFLDPYFLGSKPDLWSISANRTLRSFFQRFIDLVRNNSLQEARALFNHLHEPNETCLGLSTGMPRGNAIGAKDGEKLFNSILESRAVQTGLVEDLEDFRLFIDGIDKDKISDMTTNIIRHHLITYTQQQCELWGIPLQPNVATGFWWDGDRRRWVNGFTNMLIIDGRKILLVPKSVVSFAKKYTASYYYNSFILEYLQHEHLATGSALIQHRKDGSPYVTKKSLKDETPFSKDFLADFTLNHGEVFADFKDWVSGNISAMKDLDILKSQSDRENADEIANEYNLINIANYLIEKLRGIPAGNDSATDYHRCIVGILEFLLYPDLMSPVVENEIHEGRKRIDITFDNSASSGFFYRLHTIYQTPAQFIAVECKNYSRDVANPELDQLSGRFSLHRGKVGLLLCRTIDDMDRFIDRCKDTYVDNRGVIIPIVDEDLISLLQQLIDGTEKPQENFLADRFRSIALR